MVGYCCIASSSSSGTACGLLRRCILTAADHINDLIVAYESLRLACMVFIRLFEFFTVSFKLRRRIIRIIRPCVRSSGSTSSLRPAPPRRQRRSTAGCIGIFYLTVLLRLRPLWRPSLLVPQITAPGCALSLAHPVLATPVRAIVLDVFPGLANPGMSRPMVRQHRLQHRTPLYDCLDASPSSSPASSPTRHHPHNASSCARGFMCSSLVFSSLVYVDHGYSMHDILDHGYSSSCSATSTSAQRAIIHISYSPSVGFYLRLLLQSHRLQCSCCDCGG
uniref:Uncharacterized protein n=1 Tax=Setaria italica TaxID=4555 RepID=K3Z0U4_SETIT